MTRKQRMLVLGAGCIAAASVAIWTAMRKATDPPAPKISSTSSSLLLTTTQDVLTTEPKELSPPAIRFLFAGPVSANGIPAEWSPTVSAGKLQAKVVRLDKDFGSGNTRDERAQSAEDASALWLCSERASFLLTHRREFDVAEYPVLRWSWQATVLPTGGDVRKNALLFGENLNDQVIQLLVVFEGQKVLSFVWDSTAPVDTEVDEPSPLAKVKTRVLDSGSEHLGSWRQHEIDLLKEYERRFGQAPGKAVGVIVQSNSNHTQSVGEGYIKEITVSAK